MVKLRSLAGFEIGISFDRAENACGERGIYAFEELQEHQTD
jgi:hypothetical protein